jgi:hypothetical protein
MDMKFVVFISLQSVNIEDKSRDAILGEEIEKMKSNVEKLTEKLENVQREQKQLYLILFQVKNNAEFVPKFTVTNYQFRARFN